MRVGSWVSVVGFLGVRCRDALYEGDGVNH